MRNWLRRHFVPHDGNDFKPHMLQTTAVGGMMVLVMISFAIANFQSVLWLGSDWLVGTVLPSLVVTETNQARASESLSALKHSALLDQVATMKAEDMARNSYFAHWSPEGRSPWYWFKQAGYDYQHAGENLAVHFTDSDEVVEAWLQSPTHRENIMNGNYTEIGIGTAKGRFEGYDTVFVVQMFGSPAAVAPTGEEASSLGNEAAQVAPGEVTAAGEPIVAGIESGEEAVETVAVAETETEVEPPVVEAEESVAVTEDNTVVMETFTATENTAVSGGEVVDQETSYRLGKLLTSPQIILQIIYTVIGLFVLGVLLVAMVLEWRRHHPVQLAYSVGLLAFMIVLFQIHINLSQGIVIA